MTVIFSKWLLLAWICSQMTKGIFSSAEFVEENCLPENNITLVCKYLPKSIPRGYAHVKIFELGKYVKYAVLTNNTFENETWDQVERLEITDSNDISLIGCHFGSRSFSGLKSLRELRLDVQRYHFDADDIFAGIPLLNILDLSGSFRLVFSELQTQLLCSGCLPALNRLTLSRIGIDISQEIRMDFNFFRGLGSRNITHLDVSGMHIDFVNVTALRKELPFLTHLNVSFAQIGNVDMQESLHFVSGLQYIDASYINLPPSRMRVFPGKMVASNMKLSFKADDFEYFVEFGKVKIFNFSGIVAKAGPLSTLWIHNSTLSIDEHVNHFDMTNVFQISQIVASNNRFKYADVRMIGNKLKFHALNSIDLSRNGLEMVHPSILASAPNLESFDLSGNEINKMFIYNTEQSIEMFTNIKNLKAINLSENNITFIPYQLFASNYKLEYIDLSNNRLEQVHFDLKHLQNLKMLDFRQNNIHYLDDKSLAILRGFSDITYLNSNPLDCSTCNTKQFVHWLLDIKSAIDSTQLTCSNEHGVNVIVDKDALSEITNICARHTRIAVSSAAAGSVMIIAVVSVIIIYRYRKKLKIQKHRTFVINKLREGQGQYEFVVFLSYCSKDDEFVSENVMDALKENLQLMTGIERNLVCNGDEHLRPGRPVHDEVIRCQQRSCVVIVVLTENFCQSAYCQIEFDQAYNQRKPIVLMVKDHVDERLMTPSMQELFKRNVRILWTKENGQYVVRPSWNEICTAVLDNIKAE